MKKVFLLCLLIILSTYSFSFGEELVLNGEGAILIDYDSKEILYEKNPHLPLYPASTTKIMTGILAIELGNLEDIVTVDQEVVNLTDGSHIALEPGEELKLKDMLNALLIESANDSALAIAKHISGSLDSFVKLMNDKAKELGAKNTNFVNPNGLHDDNHVATAYDLSLIARYAMENQTFRDYVKNYTASIEPTNKKTETRYLKSANRMLYSTDKIDVDGQVIPIKYEGVQGVKSGYTTKAQNCLVTYAEKDNKRLIAVVLKSNGKNVYSDSHKLLNYGFDNFDNIKLANKNEFIDNVEITNGVLPVAATVLENDLFFPIHKNKILKVEKKIIINDNIIAPVAKGDVLGKAEYYLEGRLIGETNILSTIDVEIDPMTKLSNRLLSKWYYFAFGLIIILRIIVLSIKRKRRRRRGFYSISSR